MEYRIELPDKDYDLILTEYKEISLTQGKVALVDVEDYDYLNQWKWYAHKNKNDMFYAIRKIKRYGKRITIRMHREIIKPPDNMFTDHINRDSLDNRRSNLRICTYSQNRMNSKKNKNNTSGYRGVDWHKIAKKWRACIRINKKNKFLGYFNTKEQAALAYNGAAKKKFREFANLNLII